jgi:uncharacterized protein DUF6777
MFIVGVGVLLTSRGSGKAAAQGEIFLEGTDAPGTSMFTPSIAAPPPATTAPNATETPTPSPGGTIKTSGAYEGLYGGQRNIPSCNASALISYLEGKPAVGRPWAAALGINAADIGPYVATLTPALLRVDTRVTDYGLAGGRAVARQTVLQASTAVMLDRTGFPRVRCQSGNPLGEARAVTAAPQYTGPRWPRFAPTTLIVVTPGANGAPLVLIDVVTGDPFARIPGSVVIIDVDRPAQGVVLVIAEPGGPARITGTNWQPGTQVTMAFDNPAVAIGADTADGAGNIASTVTIPNNAAPGAHTVTVSGGGNSVPQTIYVVPPAPRR